MLGQAMAKQKLYAGTKLRELRRLLYLTPLGFSDPLELSLPYLHQLVLLNRPFSSSLLISLSPVFSFYVTFLVSPVSSLLF